MQDFKVMLVSDNTNSFGLYQMVLVARNGEVYKTCASMYNVKPVGAVLTMVNGMFTGCELTEEAGLVSEKVAKEAWNTVIVETV